MVIYTKRGDRGKTSLYDKDSRQNIRVPKDSLRIKAIGAIDEANTILGICVSLSQNKKLNTSLNRIQEDLFRVGAILAGAKLRFSSSKTKVLEKEIDKLEGTLPVLKNFVLPGGTSLAANLHLARVVIRRAEREVVALSKLALSDVEGVEAVKPEILTFLNRLSDYIFMLARKVNFEAKVKEKVWRRK